MDVQGSADQTEGKEEKKKYRQWKQGWVAWEEYRNAIWAYSGGIRKAKA